MDEVNQETSSDLAPRDSLVADSEAIGKGTANKEAEGPSPRKSNTDASSSSILIEPSNTNGVKKDSESQLDDSTFHRDNSKSVECQEETVNDSVCNKSNSELSVASESVDHLKECVDKQKDSEIQISSVDSEKIDSSTENSSKSDENEYQMQKEKTSSESTQIVDVSRGQFAEENFKLINISENKECNKNENSESVTAFEESQNEEILSSEMSKSSERESSHSLDNCSNEKESVDSSEIGKPEPEGVSSSKGICNEIQLLCSTDVESNLSNSNSGSEEISKNSSTEIFQGINKEIKETGKLSPEPRLENEEELQEGLIPQESLDVEKTKGSESFEVDDQCNESESNNQRSVSPPASQEAELTGVKTGLQASDSENADECTSEVVPLSENQQKEEEIIGESQNAEMGTHENKEEGSLESLVLQENSQKSVPQEDHLTGKCSNDSNSVETETEEEENIKGIVSKDNSDCEAIKSQEEKKSDCAIDSESSQILQKADSNESGSLNQDSGNKSDSGQEQSSDQTLSSLYTSGELEDESINKAASEGNEVMETEIINCNEIEAVDINENEGDLKGDNRDEEAVGDSLDTVGEKSSEDQLTENRECNDSEKNSMLADEEGVNQPGSSEEETITGDTTNQPSTDLAKDKDEEVCIIPDDVISGLPILPENKEAAKTKGVCEDVSASKESESEKSKARTQDKRNQTAESKPRPLRNAAKLAGNKIKSLVEGDLVLEEDGSQGSTEGEANIQENVEESTQICSQCREVKPCKLLIVQNESTHYLCSEQCSAAFKATQMDAEPIETENLLQEYVRKCSQCHAQITTDETRLFWETMDFCNEDCLGKFQLELGSNCANCKKSVPSTSLGKYCVRFGYDIKQFCSAVCLEEYKKGLKVCSYCQKDISTGGEGFLAPVGTKGQFKDFCTQSCMEKYDRMSSNKPVPDVIEECAVCSNSKPVQVEVELENKTHKLCSEPCFAAFKFVNNITEGQCDMCRKYFDRSKMPKFSLRLLFYDETLHSFCSKTCMNVYILANRKIVPCNWCKVKKYNFDMIRKISSDGQLSMMCSLNCLMLYQTSVNAVCSRPLKCDFCKKKFVRQPLYHLTMSDATLRNFCSYNCVMSFQNGYPKQKIDVIPGADQLVSPIPAGVPKRLAPKRPQVESTCVPVISSVQSLASPNGPVSPSGRVAIPRGDVNIVSQVAQPLAVQASVTPIPAPSPQVYQQIITKPAPVKQMKNKSILCKPYSHTKGVSCRPHPCMKETQTDQSLNRKFLIPIPVPIYVPAPMHMFSAPFPVPVPFPLPIPVPIFIPTTRNSAKGIMKEIKKIQEKIPTDPFEAELLMMAEMVAGEKKQDPTDSESEDGNDGDDNGDGTFSPENVDTSNTFGDDMLQIALKMASELEEPAVDMESVLTSNTITTTTPPTVDPNKTLYDQVNVMAMNRGRKRSVRGSRNSAGGTPSKRGRRTSGSVDVPLLPPPEPIPARTLEVEKPDANMCLKYTFGVNAWRHWVLQKNAELEKAALTNRKIKPFKPELLQLTADELNFSLCLFVKEVRKPNGTEYAPDTIYYLCLGIQQYLFENGRIDNIFTDAYYEKFTDCLDEVAKKFAALYNDSQYIVTRVEEEHLWESKQLGAHSPHVLLSTLMFFNTKHFNLVTVEEHMQLSFSHIMKHWKRNPNTPGVAKVPGSRNVLLRFYPPQSALEANSRKKKVYEQQENEENPLRCPVKLYEFYLSKCPESVKTRNDVFYLLPERSCVPDSPVWYSTMALGKEPLMKMLHRIKMVKEINIALLTS